MYNIQIGCLDYKARHRPQTPNQVLGLKRTWKLVWTKFRHESFKVAWAMWKFGLILTMFWNTPAALCSVDNSVHILIWHRLSLFLSEQVQIIYFQESDIYGVASWFTYIYHYFNLSVCPYFLSSVSFSHPNVSSLLVINVLLLPMILPNFCLQTMQLVNSKNKQKW